MSELFLEVGVVLARRRLRGLWGEVSWRPAAVLVAAPPIEPRAFISRAEDEELYYGGSATLALHAADTSHYRDNLHSGRPSVWVAIAAQSDFPSLQAVTVDPYEGEALAETYGEGLDAVPMPAPIRDALSSFVAAYHVERVFVKRKRT